MSTSLEVVKKQVWVVSNSLDKMKNKPSQDYKSSALHYDPTTTLPYSVTSAGQTSTAFSIKQPSDIVFPKPETTFSYVPFASPSFFGHLKPETSSSSSKSTLSEWMKKTEDESSEEDNTVNKFGEPSLEELETCVQNFSPEDKALYNIQQEFPNLIQFSDDEQEIQVNKTTE